MKNEIPNPVEAPLLRKGISTKMKPEEIAIHCLIFVILLIIGILLFQVWKYLNNKAPGSQTVLDDLAKDGIVILQSCLVSTWIVWIKIMPEYNYYFAVAITKLDSFVRIAAIAQMAAFSVIRYLNVFHFDFINFVDDRTVRIILRTFVAILAALCAGFDANLTKTYKFAYMIRSKMNEKDV